MEHRLAHSDVNQHWMTWQKDEIIQQTCEDSRNEQHADGRLPEQSVSNCANNNNSFAINFAENNSFVNNNNKRHDRLVMTALGVTMGTGLEL